MFASLSGFASLIDVLATPVMFATRIEWSE